MGWLFTSAVAQDLPLPPAGSAEIDPGDGLIPGLPPGPAPPTAEVDSRADAIATRLRCPVCQALSVQDSTSNAAVIFQKRIHELVMVGYTDEQIFDYFVDRYGEWILLDPKMTGLNALLYILPALLVGVGAIAVGGTVVQWRREPDELPLPSDEGRENMDHYERRLLEELDG